MELSNKRTYSMNQACYLASKGHNYVMEQDEITGKFYWRFPESESVKKDIYTYKTNEELHAYLSQFYKMKMEIKEARNKGVS